MRTRVRKGKAYNNLIGDVIQRHKKYSQLLIGGINMNIEKTIESLKCNGYQVTFFQETEDATAYLVKELNGVTIGFGNSATLLSMNLFERLSVHNKVIDPRHREQGKNFNETALECVTSDVFITSVNALSSNGELVNIDGTGNRVAGTLFGHKKVYFVFGINKIMDTLEDAIWRARNVAGPKTAKRLGLKTPCAVKVDRCYDCSSPERICNGMLIHYKKMDDVDMEVIIINKELGF